MFGIIGGTGLTKLENLEIVKRQIVRTPYGDASQPLIFGNLAGTEVVFLARHGGGHSIPPHAINYRANIWALNSVGVDNLLAVATVGCIHEALSPGEIVLPQQIIDYTHGRENTYYDGIERPVMHIDFTQPYAEKIRQTCINAANNLQQKIHQTGVYACVQGPRLETAAEINRYEQEGATVVGMTGMPEAALARELGMHYAALCPIANHAAGRGESTESIQYDKMMERLSVTMQAVRGLIVQTIREYRD